MKKKEKDIFDRIMEWPILRIFQPIYKKYKSILVYLFLGACCAALNIILFMLFNKVFGINELLSNILAWILATVFAFFTNRTWCFESDDSKMLQEFIKFASGRISTFFLDELIVFVFITKLGMNEFWVKFFDNAVTAIVNYLLSKFLVFNSNKK